MMIICGGNKETFGQRRQVQETNVVLADLKACSRTRNLKRGKQVHDEAVQSGQDYNIYVANALINMYAKCGSMIDAREVFDSLKQANVVSWTALILGYAVNGQGYIALDIFSKMRNEGLTPDSVTLVASLKACSSLAMKGASRLEVRNRVKVLHNLSVENDCNTDVYVQSTLVDMFAKCGSMVDAFEVFNSMKHPTVVSWNVLILGYANNGQGQTALDLFTRMRNEGPSPNSTTLVAALKACISLAVKSEASRSLEFKNSVEELRNFAMQNDWYSDVYVQSTLVDMYSKCGSMVDAREVFDGLKQPDIVSWTALISGYADDGQGDIALMMFTRMRREGPAPDSVALLAALKACTSVKEASKLREVYNIVVEHGCSSDVYARLLDMYAKCGSMADAHEMFDCIKNPTVGSWNVLILGYADNGQSHTALNLFTKMRIEGPAPDSNSFVAALKACISLAVKGGWTECRNYGKEIQSFALQNGYGSDIYVQNTLLGMFARCGSMVDAHEVFDNMKNLDVVSWTALILGYADNGEGHTALDIFRKMRSEGPMPDSFTVVAALKACTSLAVTHGVGRWAECCNRAKEIQSLAVLNGISDFYVQSTLLDMYAKCGSMVDARQVFDSMKHLDVVSWTALISGYADNSQGHAALELFARMRIEGPAPNSVTVGAALKACGLVGALEYGKTIHSELIDNSGNDIDVVLVNCLVDFYTKCGSLVEAQNLFNLHAKIRDKVTWSVLLSGYSSCGDNEAVFGMFKAMQNAGFRPDGITFLCILTYCSHASLVVKGKECFDAMSTKYGIIPTLKHYNCMIDLYGRANKLDDAMAMLNNMPFSPNDVTWRTILGACCKWKNVEIGKVAFQCLIDLNDMDGAAYVLMGQLYWSRGMLQEHGRLMGLRKRIESYRSSGETCWTNDSGDVHTFLVDNTRHPQIGEIRDKWQSMSMLMRQHGYISRDILVAQNEEDLCGHSEKLALVCALINTQPGKSIRIVKNLRVCDDCHTAAALISKLERRTIICRDASKIHFFKDGTCSCGDCW